MARLIAEPGDDELLPAAFWSEDAPEASATASAKRDLRFGGGDPSPAARSRSTRATSAVSGVRSACGSALRLPAPRADGMDSLISATRRKLEDDVFERRRVRARVRDERELCARRYALS